MEERFVKVSSFPIFPTVLVYARFFFFFLEVPDIIFLRIICTCIVVLLESHKGHIDNNLLVVPFVICVSTNFVQYSLLCSSTALLILFSLILKNQKVFKDSRNVAVLSTLSLFILLDVDECALGLSKCNLERQDCINLFGGYKCKNARCDKGLKLVNERCSGKAVD